MSLQDLGGKRNPHSSRWLVTTSLTQPETLRGLETMTLTKILVAPKRYLKGTVEKWRMMEQMRSTGQPHVHLLDKLPSEFVFKKRISLPLSLPSLRD